ncbi:S1 family peptidase [Prescottella equi]|uniref:S1 family peptidase n=1 Tax=Rhodococcus hoagii TaxID=43767 RepID=UPI001C778064|nr:S1 family peptidase [Prescottella equi]BCN80534.1 hypothetical protein RE0346_41940 [Prescottella equi]
MRSAVVSATIGAAALSATAGAQAAPDSAQPSPAALPNDLVIALQRDLNMTPQEYLDRAAAAQRVAAYASEQRRSDSGGVGGAWLAQDGTPTVAVTTQAAANRVAAAGYRAQMVPLSTSGLESAPTVPNLRSTPPPSFHVATGTAPSTMGGDSYITAAAPIASASSYLVCSFGFAAADSAGKPLALSAGHCDPNRPATGTSNAAGVYEPKIGDLRNSRLVGSFAESGIGDEGGNLDYSVIGLVADVVPTTGLGQPTVRGENGSTLTITGTAVPVAGAPVCKSGQTSGYTCGTIDFADNSTLLGGDDGESWNVRGFSTTACTLGGDSGGAIVTGTLALGITSGSSVAQYRDCATATAENPEGVMSLGIPIQAVLARVNQSSNGCVTLRTAANTAGLANCGVESGSGSLSFGS